MLDEDDSSEVTLETQHLSRAVEEIANAISPINAAAGTDASGGYISSLTEAVMGVTAGLFAIAESIDKVSASLLEREE